MMKNKADFQLDKILEGCLNFTYSGYEELLHYLKNQYQFTTFTEFNTETDPQLILRHDVDASVYPALRIAEIEKKLGIKSTFFILLSTKYYNILEEDSLEMIRSIASMGHEIGLHYDVLMYEKTGIDFNKMLELEINLVEELLNTPIKVIARHNISKSNLDPFEDSEKYINAYNPRFIKKSLYVSDSCRAWFLDDLKELLSFKTHFTQLLIHPMLWTEEVCSREDILNIVFDEIKGKMDIHYQEWLEFWYSTFRVKKYQKELSNS